MYSGPDVVNESELEIAENESVVISDQRMLGSSCSNTISGLHAQHESYSATQTASTPADIAQAPAFPPVQPVSIQFPKTTFGKQI